MGIHFLRFLGRLLARVGRCLAKKGLAARLCTAYVRLAGLVRICLWGGVRISMAVHSTVCPIPMEWKRLLVSRRMAATLHQAEQDKTRQDKN